MKNLQDIIDNIEYEVECEYIDFKKVFYDKNDYKSMLKDVMSFANSNLETDKYIIFGVKDDNDVKTFHNIEKIEISNIENIIHTNIEPSIKFSVNYHDVNNCNIMTLTIDKENYLNRPFVMKKDNDRISMGDIYIRKGASNRRADRSDIISMQPSNKGKINLKIIDDFYICETYESKYKNDFSRIIEEIEGLLVELKSYNEYKLEESNNVKEISETITDSYRISNSLQNISDMNLFQKEYNILEDSTYISVVEFSKKTGYFNLHQDVAKIDIFKIIDPDPSNSYYTIDFGNEISKKIFTLLEELLLKINEHDTFQYLSQYYKFIKIGFECMKSVSNLNISIPSIINIEECILNKTSLDTFEKIVYKDFTNEKYKVIEFEYRPKNAEEVNLENKILGFPHVGGSHSIDEYDFIELFGTDKCTNFQYYNSILEYKKKNVNSGEILCFPFYFPVHKNCKIRVSHSDDTVHLDIEKILEE